MTSTQELLCYFASKHNKPTVTVLMKLCYLADLIYYKDHGNQITEYQYQRYTFGPFDKKIYSDLEKLVEINALHSELLHGEYGDDIETVVYKTNKQEVKLEKGTRAVVDELLSALGGRGALELTQIAYKTKPMTKLNATLGGKEGLGKVLDLSAK